MQLIPGQGVLQSDHAVPAEPEYDRAEQLRVEILLLELSPGLSISLALDRLCEYPGPVEPDKEGIDDIRQALVRLGLVLFVNSIDPLADRELFLRLAWPARLQQHHPTLARYRPWAHEGLTI